MDFIIIFLSFVLLIGIASLIAFIIGKIQDKIEKRKRKKLLINHPELKLLLSEYMRLINESSQTSADYNSLKKTIDELERQNHYLPLDKQIDDQIENLKRNLWELGEIKKEQSFLTKKAYKELELFWITNFPKLKEEKRIMWWYWDKRDI